MKAVILDMYGVILKDPGEGFYSYVNKSFPKLSAEEIYAHWNKADIGEIPSLEVFRRLGFQGNLAEIERKYLETVEVDKGFYPFASHIKTHCKLALLSNDSREWSNYFRDKYKLNPYFDTITVSGDVKVKKPDERIFQLTLEKLGCRAEDCVYVDDRRRNLGVAQVLGMETVLFHSRNVAYDGKCVENFQELTDLLGDL